MSSKRELEEANNGDDKRLKQDELNTIAIDELKESIRAEISGEYEAKIKKLEQEIEELKKNKEKEGSKLDTVEVEAKKAPTLASKPTFGTSSFNVFAATPTNSVLSPSSVATPKDDTPLKSTEKPTFGATTSFKSSAFENIQNKKNIFNSIPSTSFGESKANNVTATSSFGANSKFGNAFQESLTKKSFLDEKDEESKLEENEATLTPHQFKQVDLEPVKSIQTGEEDETSIYNTNAKLFELDFSNIAEGWKERGLGPLHLNQSKQDKKQVRLVMRSNGLLRVILNYKIINKDQLLKGLEASLNPGKYLRLNSVNANGTPIQYMLKFASEAVRDTLIEKAESVISFESDKE